MRLYIPLAQNEIVEICYNNLTEKLICKDNFIELPVSLPADAVFSIKVKGVTLLNTSIYQLREADRTVRLLRGETCLDIKNDNEKLSPVNPTRLFYANDVQVVVFMELSGVCCNTPVTISWLYKGKLFSGTAAVIPASVDEGLDNYHRTYASGFFLVPDCQKGSWTVSVRLLSGKEIYSASIELLNKKRPKHDGMVSESSHIKKGGFLDELVE